MSTLQQRLAAIAETAANIKAQLRELDRLRDRVRKAELRIAAPGHCLRSGLKLKSPSEIRRGRCSMIRLTKTREITPYKWDASGSRRAWIAIQPDR
jgi:hypothetical protein